nr:MAG TPA: hypothetical protein [Caudoviricetes sp.]
MRRLATPLFYLQSKELIYCIKCDNIIIWVSINKKYIYYKIK